MKIEQVINYTNDIHSFNFFNKVLPNKIFNDDELKSNRTDMKDYLERKISRCWEEFCLDNDNTKELNPEFEFIYTVRRRLNRQKNLNSSIFFINLPSANKSIEDDTLISGGILISDNGDIKFFGLKELTEEILPARFIKNNQNYLLYELDKELSFKSWGTLINPKNFSDLSESIFSISGV